MVIILIQEHSFIISIFIWPFLIVSFVVVFVSYASTSTDIMPSGWKMNAPSQTRSI